MAEQTDTTVDQNTETPEQKLARENLDLKAALNAANARAETAERGQTDAQRGQLSEAQRRIQAELNGCKTQIESLDAEADSLESDIARLSDEPGHGKEIAALQRKLADNAADRRDQKNREVYFNNQFERAKTEAAAPKGKLLANGQPLTAFDPTAQAWLEKHPRSFTDRAYFDRVIAAAGAAINLRGLVQNSQEFFAYVEDEAEGRKPAAAQVTRETTADSPYSQTDDDAAVETTTRRASAEDLYAVKDPQKPAAGKGAMAAIAAPSRTAPGNTSVGGRRVPALNAEEREVADNLYPDLPAIDRYKRYADGKEYMKTRPSRHFQN